MGEEQGLNQKDTEGLPWWCSDKESVLQCRGHGLQPWWGNQYPTCCGATEPMCSGAHMPQLKSMFTAEDPI